MNIRVIPFAATLLLAVSNSWGQQAPVPEPLPQGRQGAAAECARQAPHNHGAGRGFPSAAKPCKPVEKGASARKKTPAGHDHGKMHKNQ